MFVPPPRAAFSACALLIALACSLGLDPQLTAIVRAGDSLLQPSTLPLPGEPGYAGTDIALPRFLQPLEPADTAPNAIPETTGAGQKQPWIGDSWMWHSDRQNGFENVRIETEAERHFAELDWWRRGFARMAVVLLACTAIASFTVLFALALRR